MRSSLLSMLLLVPTLLWAQHINKPSNRFPVFSFNPLDLTDHTTDVHNFQGHVIQTGFFQQQTEMWGFDASVPPPGLFPQNLFTDVSTSQAYFASFHDANGDMVWSITSSQGGAPGVSYQNSKIAFNESTSTYQVCIEYNSAAGNPLQLVSSTGSVVFQPVSIGYGLFAYEVDLGGNIIAFSDVVTSSSPVVLGDVDLEENSNILFIAAYRDGTLSDQAFVGAHIVGTSGLFAQINESGGFSSRSQGIDVEDNTVFVVGDYENNCQWGSLSVSSTGSQDVFLLELDFSSGVFIETNLTGADAVDFAESYDVEAIPNGTGGHLIYVTGSILEDAQAWSMGFFGATGGLHGFIQKFDPDITSSTDYVRVYSGPFEFFKMTEIEDVRPMTGFIDIAGNLVYTGTGSIPFEVTIGGFPTTYGLSVPDPNCGFIYRLDVTLTPAWGPLSVMHMGLLGAQAPTVTGLSSFEEDIIVGGYKDDDTFVQPQGQPGEAIPNLGNNLMNTFMAFVWDNGFGQGEFFKSNGETTSVLSLQEEESDWSVYPNPASEYIYFSATDADSFTDIRLKDVTGRTIKAWNGSEAINGLSIAGLPAGIYLIEVEQNGSYETHRLVIE